MTVRPAKTQISQGIRLVWSESSLSVWRNIGSLAIHWAKTLIRLGGCPGWSKSSLGAHSFCWVCHVVAHITKMVDYWEIKGTSNSEIISVGRKALKVTGLIRTPLGVFIIIYRPACFSFYRWLNIAACSFLRVLSFCLTLDWQKIIDFRFLCDIYLDFFFTFAEIVTI